MGTLTRGLCLNRNIGPCLLDGINAGAARMLVEWCMAWRDYRGTVGDRFYRQDIRIKKYNVIGFSSYWHILSRACVCQTVNITQHYKSTISLRAYRGIFIALYLWFNEIDNSYYLLLLNSWQHLDQVWSILPVLELIFLDWSRCGLTSWGGATPIQAKWIKLDQGVILSRLHLASWSA